MVVAGALLKALGRSAAKVGPKLTYAAGEVKTHKFSDLGQKKGV